MRTYFVSLHRWFGLFIAVFLFVSGLTGAIISWDHALDEWLNPKLYQSQWHAQPQSPLALANQLEALEPGLTVTYLPLVLEQDAALNLFVAGGEQAPEAFNQVALNPVTGQEQGRRFWGAVSLAPENLLPFLYKLHYSLHIPDGFGLELGVLFMGIVAIVWLLDCFVALWISFPQRIQWRKSFQFRWWAGKAKLIFDLHRSGAVWIWLLLLVLALTSVSMNLGPQIVRPLVNAVSPLSPSPFEQVSVARPDLAVLSREEILALAAQKQSEFAITAPAGGMFYSPDFNTFGVGYFTAENSHGDGGLGNPWLYFNAQTGAFVGADIPGQGSAGDIFMQAQFPLHSGRIIGMPGRILVSFLGLLVAGLSVTGVLIWARRRAARVKKRRQVPSKPNQVGVSFAAGKSA